jgi:hypothetical protein
MDLLETFGNMFLKFKLSQNKLIVNLGRKKCRMKKLYLLNKRYRRSKNTFRDYSQRCFQVSTFNRLLTQCKQKFV